jgi:hypothetical protein
MALSLGISIYYCIHIYFNRFGIGKRPVPKDPQIPGPGAYKIPSKFANVPKYLIPEKNDDYKFI